MAFEDDAVQVERLALEPAHAGPAFHQRGDHRELVVGAQVRTRRRQLCSIDSRCTTTAKRERWTRALVSRAAGACRCPRSGSRRHRGRHRFQSAGRLRCAAWCRRRTIVPQALRASARPALGQRDIRAEGGLQIGLQGFEPGHHLVRLGEPLRCFAGLAARPAALRESSARNRVGQTDLVLHLQQAVHQRLGRGRAARHVDVYRYDAVAAADHRIRVMVVTAAIGTGAHRHHQRGSGIWS